MKTFVLYHANCTDGFGGAWAAWKALGDQAEYVGVAHDEPPPKLPDGANVVLVDFAYPRDVIEKMAASAGRMMILDHHTTAEQELEGLPYAVFDMHKSGAVLAWEYWHPGTSVPDLLRYVEDRDLWRFALPNSQAVSAALGSHPRDFAVWDRLDVADLVREGRSILRFRNQVVDEIARQARMGELAGHSAPIANVTAFTSDVAEALLQRFPESSFVALYFDDATGRRRWSLRSRGDFDVAALAQRFGGGGHPSAAGFAETPAHRSPIPDVTP